jgi:hypothetical protein
MSTVTPIVVRMGRLTVRYGWCLERASRSRNVPGPFRGAGAFASLGA